MRGSLDMINVLPHSYPLEGVIRMYYFVCIPSMVISQLNIHLQARLSRSFNYFVESLK